MSRRPSPWSLLGVFLLLSAESPAQDQVVRDQLFAGADQAMMIANEALANVLAPDAYGDAADSYRDAENALQRGRSLESIREDLAEAVGYFEAAVEAAEIARVTLADAIAAREDAMAADSAGFAERDWQQAEQTFANAARRLESGNLNAARRLGDEAEGQYRTAEMVAIENNYLSGTRMRIEEAEDQRVERYAPKTLARAKQLLTEAEAALRGDRYDTDYPRTLAREANYEARHAMYLAQRIRAMNDRDIGPEDLLLQAETPLASLAGELDLVAEFDRGFEMSGAAMIDAVQALRAESETLRQREEFITVLEDEIAGLEARLGEESEQRLVQQQIQERFQQIAAVFTRDEAQILRRGNDVIVRMSLNFDVGSSVIKPEYFALLRKIQAAIDVFPGSRVEVQGHTDAFGADDTNMRLSEERARAVQQYLLANMDLQSVTIDAVGYGETVPLANNETPEGRTRNRRIDLLIQPNLGALIAQLSAN